MFESALFQWIGTIVASGGIGAGLTYLATFKSNKRKADAEAIISEETAKQEHIESVDRMGIMERDRYEAMYSLINKMMLDYNNLSNDYRLYRQEASEKEKEFIRKANDNYSLLAELKAEIRHLKRYSCYNMECPHRVKDNPETTNKE